MKLKNRVALITGASKGIGKGIGLRYSKEGAIVALASRSVDSLSEIAGDVRNAGGQALALPLDVRKPESIQEVVDKTVKKYGRLDIMVSNAGISMTHPSETLPPEDWTHTVETNLSGVFFGCQSAARQMEKQGGGCIINITSIYGLVAGPMRAAYCASKAATNMLTKVLAIEWADRNIRVNAIAPGYVRTEMIQYMIDDGTLSVDSIKKRTPQGRMGEIEEIVGLAVYLASDEASFVTGSVLTVDGGWTAYGFL
jgi:NAD(P)-dependent dehydrogenase (short-subunit alcohol dehydrogenase family)